jgi:hypothetical protein
MAADAGAIFNLMTLESFGRPCLECGRMFMITRTQTRPDADMRHPILLATTSPSTPPKGPEPCGLTPAEIRQIILEVLG